MRDEGGGKPAAIVDAINAVYRIEDPPVAWPANRATVELGTVALDRVVGFGDAVEGPLVFSPTTLPEGIATADPMLGVRDAFERRGGG